MSVVTKLDSQLNDHPNANGDQAGASNFGHDLLQVGYIVGGTNEGSSTAEKGVGTSCVHNGMLLSLFDGGAREADIATELLDWKRFSSQGCLVDLQCGGKTSVCL